MRTCIGILILGLGCYVAGAVLTAAVDPPAPWAFGFTGPPPPPGTPAPGPPAAGAAPAPDTTPHKVPGSDQTLTRAQVLDRFNVGDWHPNDHPKMPYIVQYGRRLDVFACGLCHRVAHFAG